MVTGTRSIAGDSGVSSGVPLPGFALTSAWTQLGAPAAQAQGPRGTAGKYACEPKEGPAFPENTGSAPGGQFSGPGSMLRLAH